MKAALRFAAILAPWLQGAVPAQVPAGQQTWYFELGSIC
jgi:hypothetical protein